MMLTPKEKETNARILVAMPEMLRDSVYREAIKKVFAKYEMEMERRAMRRQRARAKNDDEDEDD